MSISSFDNKNLKVLPPSLPVRNISAALLNETRVTGLSSLISTSIKNVVLHKDTNLSYFFYSK